jgi:hypothetical protein
MPRRMPPRSSRLTAGSIANDKNSEMSTMTKSGRSEWTMPRSSQSSAKPPQNQTIARGSHGGIRVESLTVFGGDTSSSATLRR